MRDTTQKPAEISPIIEQHLIRVENRLSAAQMALEMMTVANYSNRKSTKDLLSDCERLQKAAVELHQAMCGHDAVDDQAAPKVGLYQLLSEAQGKASNLSQSTRQSAQNTGNHDSQGKSEFEFTFENIAQLAKERLENQQKIKAGFAHIKTKDWVQLLIIKTEKAYKGLQVEIDGQQATIKTFSDYCIHAVGLTVRMVNRYLDALLGLGPELFEALLAFDVGEMQMRGLCKLPEDQKQALLQIAKTGDKAATLVFIDQALQAGE